MIDIADRLRRLAVFDCPEWREDLMTAAEEIEKLRESLGQIKKFVQDAVPGKTAKNIENNKDTHFASWEYYERMEMNLANKMVTVVESKFGFADEQVKLFGDHRMTHRAWNVLKNENLLNFDSILWARPKDLIVAPNVGKVTMSEIARLRRKIIQEMKKGDQ
jgi:hypothetical protein